MSHSSTKSIDVGSMFLMDLSVHESDPFNERGNSLTVENDSVYPAGLTYQRQANENRSNYANQSTLSTTNTTLTSIVHHRRDNQQKKKQQREYLGNSLDNLACAIDDGGQYKTTTTTNGKQSSFVTIVEPQPPPELLEHQSSSSLSDESYVASEGSNSLSASSYSASSNAEGDDRGSTTTREDSGVLDIKDLDSQLNNSYYNEHEERFCQPLHQQQQLSKQRLLQEKPISNSTKATNLINKSVNNYNRDGSYVTTSHPEQPTNDNNNSSSGISSSSSSSNNNHQHHNHHHQNYRSQSKRLVSASLPIQVPVRQMKKDLKKSKLNMIIKNSTAATTSMKIDEQQQLEQSHQQQLDFDLSSAAKRATYNHRCSAAMPAGVDDFEEFLEQEYNENHHNHYPIDEYDNEHLRADENPMKLFESIQALARSLHEDTELFGSLPPKRMLESPIRPLAFV